MPLLPIDLQTLFTQTNQVGRDQAAQKAAAPQAQLLQGAQLALKAEQLDHAVNETREQDNEAEKVKDSSRRGAERRRRKQGAKRAAPVTPPAPAVVRDPALGRNIDISS
jgi:hypothetical protein